MRFLSGIKRWFQLFQVEEKHFLSAEESEKFRADFDRAFANFDKVFADFDKIFADISKTVNEQHQKTRR